MEILIAEDKTCNGVRYLTAACGKKSAFVAFHKENSAVQVIVQNASHAAYRGSGRFFNSIEQAADAYKSPEIKRIIRAADTDSNILTFQAA